jgi:DNA-binding GntR family transcriptional regulator
VIYRIQVVLVKSHIFDMTCEMADRRAASAERPSVLRADGLQREAVVRIGGPRTLAAKAEEAIREAILSGELEPGSRVRIEELARAFDLSPMPVRDALRSLASAGLVEYAPHRGATVAALSLDDLRDTWEARLALETLALRRAAERFSPRDVAVVEEGIARHSQALSAGDAAAAQEAHRAVHMGLYAPSGYNWLERLVEPVWSRSERYRRYALGERGGPVELAREHRRILRVCAAHDPEAAADELYRHLVRTANIVSERLVGEPLFAPEPGGVSRPAVRSLPHGGAQA